MLRFEHFFILKQHKESHDLRGEGQIRRTGLTEIEPMGPVCPFRCQCHLRVVQCSDLGEWDAGSLPTLSALFMGMASLGAQHFQF